jgi:hypothetical protein
MYVRHHDRGGCGSYVLIDRHCVLGMARDNHAWHSEIPLSEEEIDKPDIHSLSSPLYPRPKIPFRLFGDEIWYDASRFGSQRHQRSLSGTSSAESIG